MSNQNGVITTPINIRDDVGYVLGTGSGDLGVNCRAASINKWAKHKPYRSSLVITDATARRAANFGLSVLEYGSPGEAVDGAVGGSDGFAINLPRGMKNTALNPSNADEWFRLLDFNGYNHNAPTPYGINGMSRPSVFEAKVVAIARDGNAEIKIEDFPPTAFGDNVEADLSNVYVYLLVWKENADLLTICHPTGGDVSLADITSSMNSINFTVPASVVNSNDTYHMTAVASTWVSGGSAEPDTVRWVLLPGTYEADVINDQDFILDAEYLNGDSRLDVSASIVNTMLNVSLRPYIDTVNFGREIENITLYFEVLERHGEYYDSLGVVTANFGPTDDFDGWAPQVSCQYNVDQDDMTKIYVRLWYSYQSSNDTYVYWRHFDFSRRAGGSVSYVRNPSVNVVPMTALSDILAL